MIKKIIREVESANASPFIGGRRHLNKSWLEIQQPSRDSVPGGPPQPM